MKAKAPNDPGLPDGFQLLVNKNSTNPYSPLVKIWIPFDPIKNIIANVIIIIKIDTSYKETSCSLAA